ncbi:tandem five-transmembrane protein [Terribacillus halophilus]|uniref:Tandem five-transmembrane protein n=1 Tax=Terribacillus halophilus TaxID=361279 RepID=A0A1G6L098_9BACI|nr:tandem five-transmembrane protein [Terribacillus halophilus]
MNTEVFLILKNFRYQLIKLENSFYIIDKDKPYLLVFLFPFLYWIFPKRVVQISEESANLLQTIPNKDTKAGKINLFAVGISMTIVNLTEPILDYFYIPISPLIASMIVILSSATLLYFRFLISIRNKRSIQRKLHFNNTNYLKIWLFPRPLKKMISITFMSLFAVVVVAIAMYGFIFYGNAFILLCGILFQFMLLIFNISTIPHGKNTVKIIVKS